MNKIAAYKLALEQYELEKRASYLLETYGTADGEMPAPYLAAFDALEKRAGLQWLGKKVTGGLYGLGKSIAGVGKATQVGQHRMRVGGSLMDFASAMGGTGSTEGSRRLVGGVTALGAGALGAGGLYAGSRLLGGGN